MVADMLSTDLVGTKFEPMQISWSARDTMLYALGVGSKPADESCGDTLVAVGVSSTTCLKS